VALALVLKAKIYVFGLGLDATSPWAWPSGWSLALNAWYDYVFDTNRLREACTISIL